MLQGDLARALIQGKDTLSAPAALREATQLLEEAVAGMPEDQPLRGSTVEMLTGALVAVAGGDRSPARRAEARELASALVAAARTTDDPAERGAHRFVKALVELLHALTGAARATTDAVAELVEAIALLPAGHELRPVAVGQLGALLADQLLVDGLLADGDDAVRLLERAAETVAAGDDPADAAFVAAVAAIARIGRATRIGDMTELAVATAALRTASTTSPPRTCCGRT